jgi:hypothetical protein
MAGETHEIAVGESDSLWALVAEIAGSLPPDSWVLVGGLMVQAHALRGGNAVTRQTTDVDALLNLTIATVSQIAGSIQSLGFEPSAPGFGGAFHRFRKGAQSIDVMVGQDVRQPVRWAGKDLLRSPGAAQAIHRADAYVFNQGSQEYKVLVPDSLGAIIAKAAAHKIDRRDRERHLTDVISLLASAPRGTFAGREYSAKDRQYLRHVISELEDLQQPRWLVLDSRERAQATASFEDLIVVVT